MNGCPVNAYEKDETTGIVRHLDDQCIGCQYCTLTCPYDAPKYSADRGIVRKCDMCTGRLAEGEAPACAQAARTKPSASASSTKPRPPSISASGAFLKGAPDPKQTLPTTVYKTKREVPDNAVPGDFFTLAPQHSPPVGDYVGADPIGRGGSGLSVHLVPDHRSHRRRQLAASRVRHGNRHVGLRGQHLHLGRPQYFFRAVIGVGHSWLSREIVAFAGFAKVGLLYALVCTPFAVEALPFLKDLPVPRRAGRHRVRPLGVACSVMVYVATKRVFWNKFQPASSLA